MGAILRDIEQSLVELNALELSGVDVAELYNPCRFSEVAGMFDLVPGAAFDLRTGWGLSTAAGRQACWRKLHEELPELIIGSPPCDAFSTLQGLCKPSPARTAALLAGLRHLQFSIAVYRW